MPQLVRFRTNENTNSLDESWGIQTADGVRDVGGLLASCPTMLDAIREWETLAPKIAELVLDAKLVEDGLELLSPVPEPDKVICIGLNYKDHAIETGKDIPTEPIVFNKLAGTVCGPDAEVTLPTVSQRVDFEAELVMVIGKEAHLVPEEDADQYIFGYMCGHDVSARDWQIGRPGGQWLLGKSFPNFAPIGPYLVPKSDIADPCDLSISLRINGESFQDSSTSQLIFNPWQLIAYISQCCVLNPGDIIFTGTPPGVGAARKPPRFIQSGDVCEVAVEGLGVLRNRFV